MRWLDTPLTRRRGPSAVPALREALPRESSGRALAYNLLGSITLRLHDSSWPLGASHLESRPSTAKVWLRGVNRWFQTREFPEFPSRARGRLPGWARTAR